MHPWPAIPLLLAALAAGTPLEGSDIDNTSKTPPSTKPRHHLHQRRTWPYQPADHAPLASKGCGKSLAVPLKSLSPVHMHLTSDQPETARDRAYVFWLPPGYNPNTPAPVVFSMHDEGKFAGDQHFTNDFANPNFNHANYIAVYPESTGVNETRGWQVSPGTARQGINDVAFILEVLDKVKNDLCVDENRVYATGLGQGGGMANMLACDPVASTRFAAFAPVSGSYWYQFPDLQGDYNWETTVNTTLEAGQLKANARCRPREDPGMACNPDQQRGGIPMLAFHGGKDDVAPYRGGAHMGHLACAPAIDHWIADWARRDGLDPENIRESIMTWDQPSGNIGGNKKLGVDAMRYVYGEREDKRGLVNLVYTGGEAEHSWPRAYRNEFGEPTASLNATAMMLEFFGRFSLSGKNPKQIIPKPSQDDGTATGGYGDQVSTLGSMWLVMLAMIFVALLWVLLKARAPQYQQIQNTHQA